VATAVGAAPVTPALSGTAFGIDFNPMVDRLRVVSNTDKNFRLNPGTGVVAGTDIDITPGAPNVSGVAYTNNVAGAASTELFYIDPVTDQLYKSALPNTGAITLVGSLGIDIGEGNGFDISGTDNKAYVLATVGGTTRLYSINLNTGAATAAGDFPTGARGLALKLGL